MPCLLGLIGFFFPRLVMVLLWLFTDYMSHAFKTALWPLLGFLFMPFTTLAYAFAINSHGSVEGIYLALVVVGILLDVGVLGGGGKHASKRRERRE